MNNSDTTNSFYATGLAQGGMGETLPGSEAQRALEALPLVAQARVQSVELAERILEGAVRAVVGVETSPDSYTSLVERPGVQEPAVADHRFPEGTVATAEQLEVVRDLELRRARREVYGSLDYPRAA